MGMPSFTIVVPTFDRRELVCEVVRALDRLDYAGRMDVVVVVDGARDGTAAALGKVNCRTPLRVIEQPNRGAAAARNRGAAAAEGEILLFLDDDMIAEPDLLARHAEHHAAGAAAVLGHIPLDPASPPGFLAEGVRAWAEARCERLRGGGRLELHDLLTGQLSVRRAVFEALGGFDEAFTAGGSFGNEDLDFGLRLLAEHEVRFAPDAVSRQRYVVTPERLLRQSYDAGRADALIARKHPGRAAEVFAAASPDRPGVKPLARALARVPGAPQVLARLARSAVERPGAGKTAERLFLIARRTLYWSGMRRGERAGGALLVLCYHAIADLSDDPVMAEYGVPPAEFARQLDALAAKGFAFVSPDDLRRFLAGEADLPQPAILLTFDDCYRELPTIAREILVPRAIPALAFAVAGRVTNAWDEAIGARPRPLLDGAGLAELAAAGVEIGAHSATHRQLTGLSEAELESETRGAADALAVAVPRPRFYAYPYGAHNAAARRAVEAAGYGAAFALEGGPVRRSSPRFALPRIEILARDRGWRFAAKTRFPRLARLLA
jgi:peptidoglycan/xylan/chitin deacetylase (PgdA/CDA1 family)/GT2 family glycosyltransferase